MTLILYVVGIYVERDRIIDFNSALNKIKHKCDKVNEKIREEYYRLLAEKKVLSGKSGYARVIADNMFILGIGMAIFFLPWGYFGLYSFLAWGLSEVTVCFSISAYYKKKEKEYDKKIEEIDRELRMYRVMGLLSSEK